MVCHVCFDKLVGFDMPWYRSYSHWSKSVLFYFCLSMLFDWHLFFRYQNQLFIYCTSRFHHEIGNTEKPHIFRTHQKPVKHLCQLMALPLQNDMAVVESFQSAACFWFPISSGGAGRATTTSLINGLSMISYRLTVINKLLHIGSSIHDDHYLICSLLLVIVNH